MVAKAAIAYHNETYQDFALRKGIFYGVSSSVMRYFFVAINPEFNKLVFFDDFCIALVTSGAHVGNKKHAGLFFGTVLGLAKICLSTVLSEAERYSPKPS